MQILAIRKNFVDISRDKKEVDKKNIDAVVKRIFEK